LTAFTRNEYYFDLRKLTAVFLPLALAASLLAQAPDAEVRGVVVGVGGQPLEGAVVSHRPTGARAVTGPRGEFVLPVPSSGRLRLEVSHADHYEREFAVSRTDLARELVFALTPLIAQREEIVVTALRYPEPSVKIPAAETVVRGETLAEKRPANITEGIQDVPGVGALGSGGFSLVPTVRGLARRRILYLVDGARLESERRTGPNASFVSPQDIDQIEVLKSPSSVFYGSDAIGGVIHLLTKRPSFARGIHGRLSTGYGLVNSEKALGVTVEGTSGRTAFLLSFQDLDAGDYRLPDGSRVLQSQYAQGSLLARVSRRTDKRTIDLSFLGARGTDIGKPNANASTLPTWYPRENQNLLQFRWNEKGVGGGGEILFHAFVNPNFLETRTDTYKGSKTAESFSRTQSTDFGSQLSYGRTLGDGLRFEAGVDYFGRAGASAANTYTAIDASGSASHVYEELSYANGRRSDVGVFVSADFSGVRRLDLLAGVRWDSLRMDAVPLGAAAPAVARDTAGTGFLAASYKLTDVLTAFVNAGRAYRLPSLSERFYTGISGRGFIIGQPDLRPETSLNFDGGLKLLGRRSFAGLYAFRYEIAGMIERYKISPTTYTYGNIAKGRIEGWELEAEHFITPGWKVFGNLSAIRGRSLDTGAPLNDIPPLRLYAGTRVWLGWFSAEANGVFLLDKDDPGPAEVAIPGSAVVNFRASYGWRAWNFYLTMANVLNETYIARPDAEAMFEPARSLRLAIAYAF
jgi:outer membrane receptor protein involved in Fe transport